MLGELEAELLPRRHFPEVCLYQVGTSHPPAATMPHK